MVLTAIRTTLSPSILKQYFNQGSFTDFRKEYSLVVAAWIIFLIQGVFYATIFPAWEGFDEPVHLAYIQFISRTKTLPVYGHSEISGEIQSSIESMPVSRSLFPNSKLHYGDLRGMPAENIEPKGRGKIPLYEAHQPPLYYLLMLVPYKLFESHSLLARLYATRFCSVFLASFFIFPAYGLARKLTESKTKLIFIIFTAVAFPGLYIDIARVGNDSLGVLLYSVLCYIAVALQKDFSKKKCIMAGLVLGLGLLTKMYFLTALIPLALLLGVKFVRLRDQRMRILKGSLLLLFAAGLLIMPWLIRNYRLFGIFVVTHERIVLTDVTLKAKLQQVLIMPWFHEFGVIFRSFVWVGGWSFLDQPKAVYDFFKYFLMIAGLGAIVCFLREKKSTLTSMGVPALFVGSFLLGLMDFSVLSFMARDVLGAAGGWYLYAIVVPISVLLVFGFSGLNWKSQVGQWCTLGLILGVCLMNIYGALFRLMPYYAGFPSATMSRAERFKFLLAAPIDNLGILASRLSQNKPDGLTPRFITFITVFFLLAVSAAAMAPCLQFFRRQSIPTRLPEDS